MQILSCSVYRGGSSNHVVTNKRVTVPELRILQSIHKLDGVRDVVPVGKAKEPFDEESERRRLERTYECTEETMGIVSRLFGEFDPLPRTLAQIGLDTASEAAALRAEAAKLAARAAALESPNAVTNAVDEDQLDLEFGQPDAEDDDAPAAPVVAANREPAVADLF